MKEVLWDGRGGATAGIQIAKTMTARRMETLKYVNLVLLHRRLRGWK